MLFSSLISPFRRLLQPESGSILLINSIQQEERAVNLPEEQED